MHDSFDTAPAASTSLPDALWRNRSVGDGFCRAVTGCIHAGFELPDAASRCVGARRLRPSALIAVTGME